MNIDQLAKSKRVEYLFESRCLNSLAYRCVKAHAGADAETPFLVVCYKIWNIYGLYVLFERITSRAFRGSEGSFMPRQKSLPEPVGMKPKKNPVKFRNSP